MTTPVSSPLSSPLEQRATRGVSTRGVSQEVRGVSRRAVSCVSVRGRRGVSAGAFSERETREDVPERGVPCTSVREGRGVTAGVTASPMLSTITCSPTLNGSAVMPRRERRRTFLAASVTLLEGVVWRLVIIIEEADKAWTRSDFLCSISVYLAFFNTRCSADMRRSVVSSLTASKPPNSTMTMNGAKAPALSTWSPFLYPRFNACGANSAALLFTSAASAQRLALEQRTLWTQSTSSGINSSSVPFFGEPSALSTSASAARPSMAGRGGKYIFLWRPWLSNSLLDNDSVTSGSGPAAQIVATIGACVTSARAAKKSPRTNSEQTFCLPLALAFTLSCRMTIAFPDFTK
mmetsp:Transcript_62979/g.163443  ORF Transcript_62979/g.163443 Transcript_62979/m.163443 type:complete len:349 (-) Transcript_62979:273-1319(-)